MSLKQLSPYFSHKHARALKGYTESPIWLQHVWTTLWGLKLRRARRSKTTRRTLQQLLKWQWLSEEQLRAMQNQRLQQAIARAVANVPYYRRLFRRLSLDPRDIRSTDDLVHLPLLDRETIRREGTNLISTAVRDRDMLSVSTSGSTGIPVIIRMTRDCQQTEYAYRQMQYRLAGVRYGERLASFSGPLIVSPHQERPPFWRYNAADRQLLFSVRHMSESTLDTYVERLATFQPAIVNGFPSAIALVASHALRRKRAQIRPRAVFTASETLLDSQRRTIERAFNCRVFNWYGNTELAGHAVECAEGGLHNQLLHSVIEIVDSAGRRKPPGRTGEIAATTLYNDAMPLIRYLAGDLAAEGARPCTCGRGYPLLRNIAGRTGDYIHTPDGKKVSAISISSVLNGAANILESRFVQDEVSALTVEIVRGADFRDSELAAIRWALQARLGDQMRIRFAFPGQIERTRAGKRMFLVNRLTTRERQPAPSQ